MSDETGDEKDIGKPNYGNRMSKEHREEALNRWSRGESTLAEMASDYGVTVNALSRLFKRRGIDKGESAKLYNTMSKMAQSQEVTKHMMDNLEEVGNSKKFFAKSTMFISQLRAKTLTKMKNTETPGIYLTDLKALTEASKGNALDRAELWKIYKIDESMDEEEMPEYGWFELDERDIADMREAQRLEAIEAGEEPFQESDIQNGMKDRG
tara:strand:+ start:1069 stop:1698 length:630 start_codon:yes stop_codon:yes gene_type:complete